MIFNLLNDDMGTKEEQAADRRYTLHMLEMFVTFGGGPLHMGSAKSLGKKDGNWKQVACVFYPDRAFFCKLISSAWMFRIGKDKQPGDSLAVLTSPFIGVNVNIVKQGD